MWTGGSEGRLLWKDSHCAAAHVIITLHRHGFGCVCITVKLVELLTRLSGLYVVGSTWVLTKRSQVKSKSNQAVVQHFHLVMFLLHCDFIGSFSLAEPGRCEVIVGFTRSHLGEVSFQLHLFIVFAKKKAEVKAIEWRWYHLMLKAPYKVNDKKACF